MLHRYFCYVFHIQFRVYFPSSFWHSKSLYMHSFPFLLGQITRKKNCNASIHRNLIPQWYRSHRQMIDLSLYIHLTRANFLVVASLPRHLTFTRRREKKITQFFTPKSNAKWFLTGSRRAALHCSIFNHGQNVIKSHRKLCTEFYTAICSKIILLIVLNCIAGGKKRAIDKYTRSRGTWCICKRLNMH